MHPAKWEVRFRRENEVFSILEEAIKNHFTLKNFPVWVKATERDTSWKIKEDIPLTYENLSTEKKESLKRAPLFDKKPYEDFKILGVFKDTYILVEKENNLFVVDQHALSERLHYEILKKQEFLHFPQRLLLPFLIRLTPEMFENLEKKLEILSELGFDLELISQDEILVKGAPSDLLEFTKEILENLLSLPEIDFFSARENLLKELACKRARKKGDFLSPEERQHLIEIMFRENFETCPHGRPLFIKIDLFEIEKRLKRKP